MLIATSSGCIIIVQPPGIIETSLRFPQHFSQTSSAIWIEKLSTINKPEPYNGSLFIYGKYILSNQSSIISDVDHAFWLKLINIFVCLLHILHIYYYWAN